MWCLFVFNDYNNLPNKSPRGASAICLFLRTPLEGKYKYISIKVYKNNIKTKTIF